MTTKVMVELDDKATGRINQLMLKLGETSPSAVILRALGLLYSVEPFIHEGAVTVSEPGKHGDDALVDLIFPMAVAADQRIPNRAAS